MKSLGINNNLFLKVLFLIVATVFAVIFGLVAFTGNPILVGLAVGSVGGSFLLRSPKTIIWLVVAFGLGSPALLDMGGHGLSRVLWAISMMALLLWVPGLVNLIYVRANEQRIIPIFVWLAIAFVLLSLVSGLLEQSPVGESIMGFKRYFQAFGLLLALCTLNVNRHDFDKWLKLLLGIALLQLPFALFERFILVPLRGGIGATGAEATDIVAGTMGANLQGGSPNGLMVLFVLMAFAFLFSRWRLGILETSRIWILGTVLMLPLILGETKVVVVLLPLMVLVLLRKDIVKNPMQYLPVLITLAGATFALAYLYVYIMLGSNFTEAYMGTVKYNLKEVGYGLSLLNRTTVMSFWFSTQGWQDPVGFLFGNGLGSSYGSGLQAGHVAAKYPGYGIGLTTISSLLWDVGVVGLLLYVAIFIFAWQAANKLWRLSSNQKVKADALAIQAVIALTLFFIFYLDSQINLIMHEIMIAVTLGYLAFLVKEQRQQG